MYLKMDIKPIIIINSTRVNPWESKIGWDSNFEEGANNLEEYLEMIDFLFLGCLFHNRRISHPFNSVEGGSGSLRPSLSSGLPLSVCLC